MTMDEGNRDPQSQQGNSQQGGSAQAQQGGAAMNQSGQGQTGGQSIGQSSEQGQAGEGLAGQGMAGQAGGSTGMSGQAQQFDQTSGQAGGMSGSGNQQLVDQIRSHMEVMGEDGQSIGRVDSIDGERIKLTRSDSEDGQHHYIQCSDVAGIENDQVHLHAGARPLPGNDGS